jgi:hypothetical protein
MRIVCTAQILLVAALFQGCATRHPSTPDFSRYPRSASIDYLVRHHTNADYHLANGSLLAMSAYLPEGDLIVSYVVYTNGVSWSSRVYWGSLEKHFVGQHTSQIAATNVAALKRALQGMPRQDNSPPLDRLFVFSFRDGRSWQTLTYDRLNLPKAMEDVYRVVPERNETKFDDPWKETHKRPAK